MCRKFLMKDLVGLIKMIELYDKNNISDKAIERLKEIKNVKFPSVFIVADAGDSNTLIDHVLSTHETMKDVK